jgi:hypothetical protein
MESNLATEALELWGIPSVKVSRTMVGGISGQGGGNHSAEFIKIIPLWVLVDYVG